MAGHESLSLGPFGSVVKEALRGALETSLVPRIRAHDYTVWKEVPDEIVNRLGWLHCPENMQGGLAEISEFVREVREEGFDRVLLLGMGGSSLAPEMFRAVFGVREGYLDLAVLDSTHPGAVRDRALWADAGHTLFLVSTKSGGTVETLSFFKYFFERTARESEAERAGRAFAAVTDPGSGLETMARDLGFRKVFLNDPDIGGRYSALSHFGLVPAGLVGMDLAEVLSRARSAASGDDESQGLRLGVVMGTMARLGRDKLTLVTSRALAPFGAWVEQLIAESTGKEGRGILPVHGETLMDPGAYAADRLFLQLTLRGETESDTALAALEGAGHPVVRITLDDSYDIGGECFRWEMATAVAGSILGINPFDQPNVESAKAQARAIVAAYREKGVLPDTPPTFLEGEVAGWTPWPAQGVEEALRGLFSRARPGENESKGRSYCAIQAYLQPGPDTERALFRLRTRIQERLRLATTVGYGPRFLHSTGQLHKGDAGGCLFIQITGETGSEEPIPDQPLGGGSSLDFGVLILAQALGDRMALLEAGRPVVRFHLREPAEQGIERILGTLP